MARRVVRRPGQRMWFRPFEKERANASDEGTPETSARWGQFCLSPLDEHSGTDSYARLLQADVSPTRCKNEGLEGLLRRGVPIESHTTGTCFGDIVRTGHAATPRRASAARLTYGMPFRVRVRLEGKDVDAIVEDHPSPGRAARDDKEGKLIINGAERVIVSQLHRSPGVDFKQQAEGDQRRTPAGSFPAAKLIEIFVTSRDVLAAWIDQSPRWRPRRFSVRWIRPTARTSARQGVLRRKDPQRKRAGLPAGDVPRSPTSSTRTPGEVLVKAVARSATRSTGIQKSGTQDGMVIGLRLRRAAHEHDRRGRDP